MSRVSLTQKYEVAGLTGSGFIKINTGCPFIKICGVESNCPTHEKNYPYPYSCGWARALATDFHEEIKRQLEEEN